MKYAKGTVVEAYDEIYMIVGKLYTIGDSYVLAPQEDENIDVIIYTEDEIDEGIEEGWLAIKE